MWYVKRVQFFFKMNPPVFNLWENAVSNPPPLPIDRRHWTRRLQLSLRSHSSIAQYEKNHHLTTLHHMVHSCRVRSMLQQEESLIQKIRKRRLTWFGYVTRMEGERLLMRALHCHVEGEKSQGRVDNPKHGSKKTLQSKAYSTQWNLQETEQLCGVDSCRRRHRRRMMDDKEEKRYWLKLTWLAHVQLCIPAHIVSSLTLGYSSGAIGQPFWWLMSLKVYSIYEQFYLTK